MPQRTKSEEVYTDSCKVIVGGVNSPVRSFPNCGISPIVVDRGLGDTIWDVDGNAYIDYCCSWGVLILGHAHPKIVDVARKQIEKGSTFGMATQIEMEIAQHIVWRMPSIEKIRFVSSGTEAVMSAIRLARGFTKKSLVIKFNGNYHGHSDGLLIHAGSGVSVLNKESSSEGVPQEYVSQTVSLPYNDVDTCREFIQAHEDIAAVIVEPMAGNMGFVPASQEFLDMLREETTKKGIVLIFDEVITGFRVGPQGAQGVYGIVPDLTCLGKIIGGGFPAAAFGGRSSIMDHLAPIGKVYQAGTLSGNPVAMAAGLSVLKEIESVNFYEDLEKKANLITKPVREFMQKHHIKGCVQQYGSIFTVFFGQDKVINNAQLDRDTYKEFFTYLFSRGIYFPPSQGEVCFVSMAHTTENLLRTKDEILNFLRDRIAL